MAEHVIIGTAGHVDHGKTTLIRALTGIDTDRLKQEKERGITIELGFAWFDLPDGRRAGIVDVPGHERFVRNMLAGATGIDVVLLVVAADEGVMPQTREHLHILEVLGVQTGIVVITKADLVEAELLELAREDIDEALAGTFMAKAPRVAVSAVSGLGIDELKELIGEVAVAAPPRQRRSFSRLPVDRVFVQKGFGTVVTGTLLDDVLNEGDQVLIMPGELSARVRQLQVHGSKVTTVQPGQRVAVNLAGIERSQIHRGQVVFRGRELAAVDKIAARLQLLPDAPPLVNNSHIRFHCGANEALGRAVLLEGEELTPGGDALVQFRLDEPVMAVRGDRYVIRSWSPVTTIGGGEIIETGRRRLSRNRPEIVEALKEREQGDAAVLVKSYLDEAGMPLTKEQLLQRSQLPPTELDVALSELELISFSVDGQNWLFSRGEDFLAALADLLTGWHQQNPLRAGMPREEVRSRLLPDMNTRSFAALLETLLPGTEIELRGQELALANHKLELSAEQERLRAEILEAVNAAPFAPPERGELEKLGRQAAPLLALLQQQGELVAAGDFLFARSALDRAVTAVRDHFAAESQLTLAQFRDYLQTSRKYALPLIEYLDGAGFTRRRGDVRLPGPALREENS
ncbi:MAG: selenocysteine-specific translation elongation factor [Firmicutes bacterium]|nr:selenocysteine-specific translation elongation factor [Bacillota bacterium]